MDVLHAQTAPRASREGEHVPVEFLRLVVEPTFWYERGRVWENRFVVVVDVLAVADDGLEWEVLAGLIIRGIYVNAWWDIGGMLGGIYTPRVGLLVRRRSLQKEERYVVVFPGHHKRVGGFL